MVKPLHSVTASGILHAYFNQQKAGKGRRKVPAAVVEALNTLTPKISDDSFMASVWRTLNSLEPEEAVLYAIQTFDRKFFFYADVSTSVKERLARDLVGHFDSAPTTIWKLYLDGRLTPPIIDNEDEEVE